MKRALTDLSTLPSPVTVLPSRDDVGGQRIGVPVAWWNDGLARRGLPGGPLAAADGTLSREEVWRLAPGAAEDDRVALRLLWHALAWGAGSRLRMCGVRMNAVAEDLGGAGKLLREAAGLAGSDPAGAYDVLHPHGGSAISGLGPSFGPSSCTSPVAASPGTLARSWTAMSPLPCTATDGRRYGRAGGRRVCTSATPTC